MGTLYNVLNNVSTSFTPTQKQTARNNIGFNDGLFISTNNSINICNDDSDAGKLIVSTNVLHLDTLPNNAISFASPQSNTYTLSHNTYSAVAANKPYKVGRDIFGHVVYGDEQDLITADDISAAKNDHWHGYLMRNGKIVGGTFTSSGGTYIEPSSSTALCVVDMDSYILMESTIKFGTADDDINYYLNPRGQWVRAYSFSPSNKTFSVSAGGYISVSFTGSWLSITYDGIKNNYTHPSYGTYANEKLYSFYPLPENETAVTGNTDHTEVINTNYGHVFGMSEDSMIGTIKSLGISTSNTTYKFETGATNGTIKITPYENKATGTVTGESKEYSLGGLQSAAFMNTGKTAKTLPLINSSNGLRPSMSSTEIYPVVIADSNGTLKTTDSPLGKVAEYVIQTSTGAGYIVPFNITNRLISLNYEDTVFKINSNNEFALIDDKLVTAKRNIFTGTTVQMFYTLADEDSWGYPGIRTIDAPIPIANGIAFYDAPPKGTSLNLTTLKSLMDLFDLDGAKKQEGYLIEDSSIIRGRLYDCTIHIPNILLETPDTKSAYVISFCVCHNEFCDYAKGRAYPASSSYQRNADVVYHYVRPGNITVEASVTLHLTTRAIHDGQLLLLAYMTCSALCPNNQHDAITEFWNARHSWVNNFDNTQAWITVVRVE